MATLNVTSLAQPQVVGAANVSTYSNVSLTSTNATYYPTFVSNTSGSLALDVGSGLTFNPNTSNLTTGILTTANAQITGGTINNTVIGGSTASSGTFNNLIVNTNQATFNAGLISTNVKGTSSFALGGSSNIIISATAPTISSGFGTSPSIVSSNGTACFQCNVGYGGSATSGVIAMPAAANGWYAVVNTPVTQATGSTVVSAQSNVSITLTNYTLSTGVALAWPANYKIWIIAHAF